MALVLKDRVKETTTTTGTGTLTLAGAMSGFQAFSVIGNANTTYYAIYEPSGTAWEVGIGTYTLAGTTLSRDTILASSNAGAAVNFGAGTKVVFCTYPAGKSIYYDASSNLPVTGALNVTSASATSLAVGLTGATNPAFTVDSSTASQVAGLKVTGAATGGTVAVVATDSGSDTNLTVNAKGTGTIGIGSVSTGLVTITPSTVVTGTLGVGSAPSAGNSFTIAKNATGATTAIGALVNSQIQSDVTSAFRGYQVTLSTQATAFTITDSFAYAAFQGTLGVGSTVTNQRGFSVGSNLTGATNNYGFYSEIASGTGRFNFYAAGTANNYMAGSLGIGSTSLTAYNLRMSKTMTGSTSAFGIAQDSTIQSDVTTSVYGYRSALATQAAAFTLGNLFHVSVEQGTFGAASAVTNQYGVLVSSSLTGATNNYGFYSGIASGTGRFNFYAAGTAANFFGGIVTVPAGTAALPAIISTTGTEDTGQFFPAADTIAYSTAGTERMRINSAGSVGIGTTSLTGFNLRVTKAITGATTAFGIINDGQIQTDVTDTVYGIRSRMAVAAAATVPTIYSIIAEQATFGAGATVTNQFGFVAGSSLTGATNNYGFYGSIASGTGRYNLYMAGTAANYFGGTVTIQTASATALAVGLNGATNPAFTIDSSTASQAAGFKITGAATGGTVALVATDSGSNTSLSFNAKGTGTISVGNVSTGDMIFGGTADATRRVEITTNGLATFAYGDNSLSANITLQNLGASSTTNHGSSILWRTRTDSSATAINSGRIAVIKEQLWTSTASTQDSAMAFYVTVDGSMSERMRISSNGSVGLGGTSATTALLNLRSYSFAGAATGAIGVYIDGTVPSTLTSNFQGFRTNIATAASAFTCANGYHFYAAQGTIGATSALTNQFGYVVDASLTGATNNYGFFGDLASGTGRWNLYMQGSAKNYLASGVNIGSTNDDNWLDDSSNGAASTTLYIGNQSITTSSDIRLKTNIQDTEIDALGVVNKLRVVDFNWEDPSDTSWNNKNARGRWTGLIAQEAIEHVPYAVNAPRNRQTMEPVLDATDDCGKDIYWFMEYQQIVPVLIKAIQQQQQQINELKRLTNT
jgi:hypothetical protein